MTLIIGYGALPRRPPYPQPTSANSTWAAPPPSEGEPGKKSGYSGDQSIFSGLTGLGGQEVDGNNEVKVVEEESWTRD